MYCPRCATQNLDDAKFCRACGVRLEAVALALADQYHPAGVAEDRALKVEKEWLEKRSEGTSGIGKGIGLLGASLLIGVALGLFSNQPDWIIIWVGLAGWMACWGFISLTSGIHALVESRFMARQMKQQATGTVIQPSTDNPQMLPEAQTTNRLSAVSPSVTEHTTELLTNQPSRSKQTN
jgi:hypothetical protein